MKSTETAETVGQSPQKLFHSLRLGGRTRPNSRDSLRGLSSFNSSNRERHFSTVDLVFLNCTFAQTSVNDTKLISANNRIYA